MLRTGIATLMICVVGTTSVNADDVKSSKNSTLMEWLISGGNSKRSSSSVRRAVVSDASRQAPRIRQTSDHPAAQPQPGAMPLTPLPIQTPPVVPNTSPVSGPQYFSATNAQGIAQPVHPGRNWQQYQAPQPVQRNSRGMYSTITHGVPAGPAAAARTAGVHASNSQSGAPLHPGSALYPSPRPGIPHQMGGTTISNQFLNPHEMLYAHRYRAMYPPYYYKVNGKWMVTPFGVWSHEDWNLQGTMVDVKYHSRIGKFAMFKPPITR